MHSWIPPQLADSSEHYHRLTQEECDVFYGAVFPWKGGIAGLWHWRGQIAKKLLGRMPTPEEVDVPADNAYWQEDFVEEDRTFFSNGESKLNCYWRCGRRLKETSPYVRRYRESLSRS